MPRITYPTSDGQPMAESTVHRKVMTDVINGLEDCYCDVPDVWVGGNLFLCYEKGNPEACVAPDVLLAKRVRKWLRPNYLLWRETTPSLVVEVTSEQTRKEDEDKKSLYERLGVEELILFDPYEEYLQPKLQGYYLTAGRYQPVPLDEDGSLLSRTTGVRFVPEGNRLRLVDDVTGERLLWGEELGAALKAEIAARQAAEVRAAEEAAVLPAAEERVLVLEAELDRLRKG
jgi:putative restriction endonuclease